MARKYISLLRGINVSGQKMIKMLDLKSLYESLGFEDVATYIQSGNVLFNASSTSQTAKIKAIIESGIKSHFGFDVPVDVRIDKDFKTVIKTCPYEEAKHEENGSKVLVSFLSAVPSPEAFNHLAHYAKSPERIEAVNDVIYLYCPNGYGKSKLTNTLIESKLGLISTTRNWKTVHKLVSLSEEK